MSLALVSEHTSLQPVQQLDVAQDAPLFVNDLAQAQLAQSESTHCVCRSGYGRCWWAHPNAAELPHKAAQALRQDRCHQLQIRWLMPQVMLELTSFQAESSQDSSGAAGTNGHAPVPKVSQGLQTTGRPYAALCNAHTVPVTVKTLCGGLHGTLA